MIDVLIRVSKPVHRWFVIFVRSVIALWDRSLRTSRSTLETSTIGRRDVAFEQVQPREQRRTRLSLVDIGRSIEPPPASRYFISRVESANPLLLVNSRWKTKRGAESKRTGACHRIPSAAFLTSVRHRRRSRCVCVLPPSRRRRSIVGGGWVDPRPQPRISPTVSASSTRVVVLFTAWQFYNNPRLN